MIEHGPNMTFDEVFDYIVVGAGSAGCVLANRLSSDSKVSVLLLEAGPEDRNFWMRIPAGMTKLFAPSSTNWGYFTEPEPHLNNRKIYWPRGKTLGGTSSINGMVYLRGHPQDYDRWAHEGGAGWSWQDVIPYFKRSEAQQHGASNLHGADGPLDVTDVSIDDEASRRFIESAVALGLPHRRDLNDGIQTGVGRAQVTVKDGRRVSTATAYLHPVRGRANLAVYVNALAEKVLLEGTRAIGVRFRRGGDSKNVRARREVILAGGVINSPQLLMLSGIGPGSHLQQFGIPVVKDLAGVGGNLQDHLYVYYTAKCDRSLSLNHELSWPRLLKHVARYSWNRTGLLNIGAVQATAFPIVAPGAERPDVEISFRPMSLAIGKSGNVELHRFPAINASCSLLRPQARGRVRLAGPEADSPALIYANYLDNDVDLDVMRSGLRWIRSVFEADPLAKHIVEEFAPGGHIQSDGDWEEFTRANAQSVYHPVGTCRMGRDADAVVDHELKVRGIDGLRVADASIMPYITSSNTNAPTIMIGEKAADMIASHR